MTWDQIIATLTSWLADPSPLGVDTFAADDVNNLLVSCQRSQSRGKAVPYEIVTIIGKVGGATRTASIKTEGVTLSTEGA